MLTWEPFDWGRRRNDVAEKAKTVEQARNGLRETESQIAVEVGAKYRKWQEAALLLKAARTGHEAATEQFRVTSNKYKEEAALIKDLLQAQARSPRRNFSTSRRFRPIGARSLTCAGRWEMNEMKNIFTMLLLALVMAGCHSNKPIQQAPQAVQTQRLEANPANSSGGLRFSAVVTPDAEVPLAFRIPGYVIAFKQVRGQDGRMRDIAEGDRVSKGAVLVRIRAAEYEDKVRQATSQAEAAEAAAQKAKLDFDRATRLYDTQSITKPDFDAA